MRVEIHRRGSGRDKPTYLVIDGERCRLPEAAERLGLTKTALQKRLERGSSLARPYERHVSE